jgi:predicted N-acetyltransferase YhbS
MISSSTAFRTVERKTPMYKILRERPADAGDIEQLLDLAFGPNRLAKTSYRYRDGGAPVSALSWIARDGDRLVGTIRYWPILVGKTEAPALLLGPLAVDPSRRGEGIGRMLVARTLDQAMLSGHRLVLLVADPGYYEQFGCLPAASFGFAMPDEKPERLWVRPLAPGALHGIGGVIKPRRSVRGRGLSRRPRDAAAARAA